MSSLFRKKPVTITAHQWFKNGDHPEDGSYLIGDGHDEPFLSEGKIVRRYRHPMVPGTSACEQCGKPHNDHGWIDTLEQGHRVCPGDWIIKGVAGEFYPCKPDIFAATYEPGAAPTPAAQSARQEAVRYFVYDNEYGYNEFKTDAERDSAHRSAIEGYLDDGWSEEVESVVSGIVTHKTVECNVEHAPPRCEAHPEQDGDDCDACDAWNEWPNHEFDYTCSYEPEALAGAPMNSGEREQHPDDVAVDKFAQAMKEKLADARAKGRSGWETCDPADLSRMLREHVEKGDPRDVANFCAFLWNLGKPISAADAPQDGSRMLNWDSACVVLNKWLKKNPSSFDAECELYRELAALSSSADAPQVGGEAERIKAIPTVVWWHPDGYIVHNNLNGDDLIRRSDVLAALSSPAKVTVDNPDELTPPEFLASHLIDAWVAAHGKKIPWDKAIKISAIVTKMPGEERDRLLALGAE